MPEAQERSVAEVALKGRADGGGVYNSRMCRYEAMSYRGWWWKRMPTSFLPCHCCTINTNDTNYQFDSSICTYVSSTSKCTSIDTYRTQLSAVTTPIIVNLKYDDTIINTP
jgi:hypothetical protein